MSTKVLVRNLPPGTAEEELMALFAEVGTAAQVLDITDDGNPDRLTATVSLDIEHSTAMIMADNAKPRHFKGRLLEVYVPRKFE